MHLNVDVISQKQEVIEIFLGEEQPDIFLVSELGLTSSQAPQFGLEGYTLKNFRSREHLRKGGVAIYVKNLIEPRLQSLNILNIGGVLSQDLHFEATEISFLANNKKCIVSAVYRSPDGDENLFLELLEEYVECLFKATDQVIIGGDFNIPFHSDEPIASSLHDLLSTFGLSISFSAPTRISHRSESCIDNILTSVPFTQPTIIEPFISDHTSQSIIININISDEILPPSFPNLVRLTNDQTLNEFKTRLRLEEWRGVYGAPDTESKCSHFLDTVNYLFDVSCPKVISKPKSQRIPRKDWVNQEILTFKDRLKDIYDSWKITKTPELGELYRRTKNQYRKLVKKTKSDFFLNKIVNSENRSAEAWRVINQARGSAIKTFSNITIKSNGIQIKNPEIVSNVMNNFFSNISSHIHSDLPTKCLSGFPKIGNQFFSLFPPCSQSEVLKIISSMKPKTSCGLDGISMRTVKLCSEELAKPLCHIINSSLESGVFPQAFKTAKIKPIHKKDDKEEVSNYRPISLLPSFSKIFERVVCDRLTHYLETNVLFFSRQFGFRKGLSTKSALVQFVSDCLDYMDGGGSIVGCFADLSKAFDCVVPDVLIEKVASLGITSTPLNWLISYLTDRQQITEIQHQTKNGTKMSVTSAPLSVRSGVPQGSILGPLLFLIYINDINHFLPEDDLVVYADDTTLFTKNADQTQLEIDSFIKANQLSQYFSDLKLSLNPHKTNYILIQSKQRHNSKLSRIPHLEIEETQLANVSSVNFLGVRLDDSLSWEEQISHLRNRLSAGLFVLRNIARMGSIELSKLVYFSLFESHVNYSIILWGNSSVSNLELIFKLQKRAVRYIYGLRARDHCKPAFHNLRILTVPCIFIFEIVMYAVNNNFTNVPVQHNHFTRYRNNRSAIAHNLRLFENKPNFLGPKFFNKIPQQITSLGNTPKFRFELKRYLIDKCFYNINEFLDD